MYYQRGRFSFYLSKDMMWLRIRDKQMNCGPLFIKAGKEI